MYIWCNCLWLSLLLRGFSYIYMCHFVQESSHGWQVDFFLPPSPGFVSPWPWNKALTFSVVDLVNYVLGFLQAGFRKKKNHGKQGGETTVDGNQKSGKLTSWGTGSFFPIIYRVLAPSQSGCWGFLNHQQYVCFFLAFLWKIFGLGRFFEDLVS